jgi:hypothetical protein
MHRLSTGRCHLYFSAIRLNTQRYNLIDVILKVVERNRVPRSVAIADAAGERARVVTSDIEVRIVESKLIESG